MDTNADDRLDSIPSPRACGLYMQASVNQLDGLLNTASGQSFGQRRALSWMPLKRPKLRQIIQIILKLLKRLAITEPILEPSTKSARF